jgi:hypothetical protein
MGREVDLPPRKPEEDFMNRKSKVVRAVLAALAVLAVVSCTPAAKYSALQVAEAARDLRVLVPAIEAGLALAVPDSPTERAVTPSTLKTTGVANPWTYGAQTPTQVYGSAVGTIRLPESGYYESTSGDQLYFTLTPETGTSGYFRVVLYTYPAFDLVVAHTIEEYLVNNAGTESWAWGNLDLSKARDRWISLTTVYVDGTTGTRTLQWSSGTSGSYYEAFTVGEPVPGSVPSLAGYRIEELTDSPPASRVGSESYSSHVTEQVKGKGTVIDATQFYTETTGAQHSGLTYVIKDKKRKWSVDTFIVTRMHEDTTAGTKNIRSVGELGTAQYYIDKVDITRPAGGALTYVSTHDVYNTALPRGGDESARDYVAMLLTEDGAGLGTYTGTAEETQGKDKIVHDVTIKRDQHYRLAVSLKLKSTTPRGLVDDLSVPLTRQDISSLSIPVPGVEGTFEGYYEAGALFGTITTPDSVYEVVVAEEGIAVDEQLFAYNELFEY